MKQPFLFLVLIIVFTLRMQAQVIINEISYNPPESGNDSLEYVELFNAGASGVNIHGWYFAKGIDDTLPDMMLDAGAYFVTAIKSQAMSNVFGIAVHQWKSGALSNSGETITLVDAGGNLVDSVAYKKTDPWPTAANGMGPSLELKDAGSDNNDGSNWQASGAHTGVIINGFEVSGTPGAQNSGGSTGGPAITIDLANFQFTPKNAVVKIGDLVRWVNNDPTQHNVDGLQSVYPMNPADLYSGAPAAGPWQFDFTPTVAGLYNYQCDIHVLSGMVGTLGVYDPLTYTDFPLRILRLTDGMNGQHIYNGVPTTVTGVVHGVNFLPTGYSFYIINSDNIGINVFSAIPGSYTVAEGDMVKVSGVIDQFNGLLEIVPDAIEMLSSGNALNVPWTITEVTEEDEGSYIEANQLTVDSVQVTGTSGFNIFTSHPSGSKILIRVDVDAPILLTAADFHPGDIIAVTGIGTQFDASFPYTEGYQILAVQLAIINGLPALQNDAISMSPNPVTEQLTFSSSLIIESLELYSRDGKQIRVQKGNDKNRTLNVSDLSAGIYFVRAVTTDGIWTSKVIVER